MTLEITARAVMTELPRHGRTLGDCVCTDLASLATDESGCSGLSQISGVPYIEFRSTRHSSLDAPKNPPRGAIVNSCMELARKLWNP